jgi:hypothetical protein
MWIKKRRGWSDIWTHPMLIHAIVDTRGFGQNPRISFEGIVFSSVKEAKSFALEKGEKHDTNCAY